MKGFQLFDKLIYLLLTLAQLHHHQVICVYTNAMIGRISELTTIFLLIILPDILVNLEFVFKVGDCWLLVLLYFKVVKIGLVSNFRGHFYINPKLISYFLVLLRKLGF